MAVEPGATGVAARGGRWKMDSLTDPGYAISASTVLPLIPSPPVDTAGERETRKKPEPSAQGNLVFKISDNLSVTKLYRGTMNGKWILMDYDAKSNLLTYLIDEHMPKGKNNFHLRP